MMGIRVRNVPKKYSEKTLKIYFSKPENGGGEIQYIYFPLFNNDAVIQFKRKEVVESILQRKHIDQSVPMEIISLPEHMIFSLVSAKLNMDASVLIQTTLELRDEIIFVQNIKLTEEADKTYSLHGNLFQLEWAWHYIDCFMQRQEIKQHKISQQPQQHYARSPQEVDHSEPVSSPLSFLKPLSVSPKSMKTGENSSSNDSCSSSFSGSSSMINSVSKPSNHGESDTDSEKQVDAKKIYDDQRYSTDESTKTEGIQEKQHTEILYQSLHTDTQTKSIDNNYPDAHREDFDDDLSGSFHEESLFRNTVDSTQSYNSRKDDENKTFQTFSGQDLFVSESVHASDLNKRNVHKETSHQVYDGPNHSESLTKMHGSSQAFEHLQLGKLHKTLQKHDPEPLPLKSHLASISHDTDVNQQAASYGFDGVKFKTSMLHQQELPMPASGQSPEHAQEYLRSCEHGKEAIGKQPEISTDLGSFKSLSLSHKIQHDKLISTFSVNSVQVTISCGNLLHEKSDAIVNAANKQLRHYGGISYKILQARGTAMDEECKSHIKINGYLKITEVTHTSGGGKLNVRYIIHAAGPMWLGKCRKDKFIVELTKTFLNCFEYAEDKLKIMSIALPALSTGVNGAPLEVCVQCFLYAILIYSKTSHSGHQLISDIRMVIKDADSAQTFIRLVQTLLDTGSDQLTAEALQLIPDTQANREMNLSHGRTENKDLAKSSLLKNDFNRSRYSSAQTGDQQVSGGQSLGRVLNTSKSASGTDLEVNRYKSDGVTKHAETNKDDNHIKSARDRADSFSIDTSNRTNDKKSYETNFSHSLALRPSSALGTSSGQSSANPKKPAAPKIKDSLLIGNQRGTLGLKTSDTSGACNPRHLQTKHESSTDDDESALECNSVPSNLCPVSSSSLHEKFRTDSCKNSSKPETCAICLDELKLEKSLPCKHKFCEECIDKHYSKSKPTCPLCGTLYGKLVGDQPKNGFMTHRTDRCRMLPGYEKEDGMITITYVFPDGIQESCHPHPGRKYKGIIRQAYLPNSVEGREVLHLLKTAFDAQLVFTIGDSHTTGKTDMLTWNDIHHKTNIDGGSTKFGYPDPTYLARVKAELAIKGIM